MENFPLWFENDLVIGTNTDGEKIAVGLSNKKPWLCHQHSLTGAWITAREARQEDVAKYDVMFLSSMKIKAIETGLRPW